MSNEEQINEKLNELELQVGEKMPSLRRVGIAAEILLLKKERVTQKAVKDITGGSYGDIKDPLAIWSEKKKNVLNSIKEPIPDNVQEKFNISNAETWNAAIDEANRRLELDRESLNEKQLKIEDEIAGAEKEIEEQSAKIKSQAISIKKYEEEYIYKQKQLSDSINSNEVANKVINELKVAVADKEKIEAELIQLKDQFKESQFEVKTLAKEKSTLDKTLLTAQSEHERTKEILLRSEKDKATEINSNETLKKQKDLLLKDKEELAKHDNALELQIHKLQSSLDSINKTSDENKNQLIEVRKMISKREREAGELTGMLNASKEENKRLEDRASELENMLANKQ